MSRKLQPKFIPNEAPEDTEIPKDLAIEKFKSEIGLFQTQTEKYEQRISKPDCILANLFRRRYYCGTFTIAEKRMPISRKQCQKRF